MTHTAIAQWTPFTVRLAGAFVILASGMIAKLLLTDTDVFNDVWASFLVLASVPMLLAIGRGRWGHNEHHRRLTQQATMIAGLFTVILAAVITVLSDSVVSVLVTTPSPIRLSPLALPGIAAITMVLARQMLALHHPATPQAQPNAQPGPSA